MVYTHDGSIYCDACGEFVRGASYYGGSVESDSIDLCECGQDCANAIQLENVSVLYGAETSKIGICVTDNLTDLGREWLRDFLTQEDKTPFQESLAIYYTELFPELADEELDMADQQTETNVNKGS